MQPITTWRGMVQELGRQKYVRNWSQLVNITESKEIGKLAARNRTVKLCDGGAKEVI